MPQYTPPLRDLQFVLHELLEAVPTLNAIPAFAELDIDTVNAVLEEGGKFAAEVIQPLNLPGDQQVPDHEREDDRRSEGDGETGIVAALAQGEGDLRGPEHGQDPAQGHELTLEAPSLLQGSVHLPALDAR